MLIIEIEELTVRMSDSRFGVARWMRPAARHELPFSKSYSCSFKDL